MIRLSGVVSGDDYRDKESSEICYPDSLAPCAPYVDKKSAVVAHFELMNGNMR